MWPRARTNRPRPSRTAASSSTIAIRGLLDEIDADMPFDGDGSRCVWKLYTGMALWRLDRLEGFNNLDETGDGAGVHFPHHGATMHLDRDLAEIHAPSDLLIEQALRHII